MASHDVVASPHAAIAALGQRDLRMIVTFMVGVVTDPSTSPLILILLPHP